MSFWPKLLRAILIVSLILDGSGYAVASAQMQMQTQTGHMTVSATPAASEIAPAPLPPCHEQPHEDVVGSTALVVDVARDATQPGPDTDADECCSTGACSCDCTHAQATLPTSVPLVVNIGHVRAVSALQAGHAAPALPHSMRPPIA